MSELTDLEIRKMITEIEIKRLFPRANSVEFDHAQNCYWIQVVGFESYPLLNPLTDDALCFRLMVRYEIVRDWEAYDQIGWYYTDLENQQSATVKREAFVVDDHGDNRAICLAIIKDKSHE